MTLESWKNQQTDPAARAVADLLIRQYGDRPLPSNERQGEVKRFSTEDREGLEASGLVILKLTRQTIGGLRAAGRKFWSSWHQDYPDFEALPSRGSEVAINPRELFIPGSNRKSLQEQERMVQKFSRELSKKIKGVEAIIGEAPDYVELAFAYLDATGERLFGEKYDYNYARTKTPTAGSSVANVGNFDAGNGLGVYYWDRDSGRGDVFASPLAVPK